MSNVTFADGGDFDGSFEEWMNFSKDGVLAPAGLKTAGTNNKRGITSCAPHPAFGRAFLYRKSYGQFDKTKHWFYKNEALIFIKSSTNFSKTLGENKISAYAMGILRLRRLVWR
jgi:hypothetical protein